MRPISERMNTSVLQLRGGTQLVIFRSEPGVTKLDLMVVDDLDDINTLLSETEANP